ncbi:hypothetical protein LCGC14_0463520 [marine sediment metagenome]|uniref:Uncharacterized protein n=1 Tax=marine sediment metagenome TaxID=412755 RepID=A0A0F9SXF0_9ZZZZ
MNISEDCELDYYLKIIENFQDVSVNQEKTVILKSYFLIKMMKLLDYEKNRDFVTNAIIVMLSLAEDLPPDNYNNLGIDVKSISVEERKFLMKNLKEEFSPN